MMLLLAWLILAALVGIVAGARGRSGGGWMMLGIIISPLLAGLIVAVLPDLRERALLQSMADSTANVGAGDDRAFAQSLRRGRRDEVALVPNMTFASLLAVIALGSAAISAIFVYYFH
jgi:hypothetical protein